MSGLGVEPEPATPPPLAGATLLITAFMLASANFLVVLDTTIANVSVPSVAGGLGVSPSEGAWVITSYGVAEAITVSLTGWLSARFGAGRTFVVAMALFGVFSALCGASSSFGMLVAFRVLQGLAGGPMIPLSQTLLPRVCPPRLRGAALGLWAMTTVVGPIAGPILGGTLCDNVGWEAIFYVNVPAALVIALVLGGGRLRRFENPPRKVRVDLVGLALLVIWVGALQIMLDKGPELDWFDAPLIVELALIGAVAFAAFLIWELTEDEPIVNLRVFRSSTFSIGALVLAVGFAALFAQIVILPLWLQTSMGYTATMAGLATAPQGFFAIIVSPIVGGVLLSRIDVRALVTFGMIVLFAVAIMRSLLNTDADFWAIATPQFVIGLGVPFFFVGLTSLTTSRLAPHELAAGAGLMNFMRTTAGAFGASLATTVWAQQTQTARASLVANITPGAPGFEAALKALESTGQERLSAIATIDRLLEQQAVSLATNAVFFGSGIIFLLCAVAVWFTRPKALNRPSAGH